MSPKLAALSLLTAGAVAIAVSFAPEAAEARGKKFEVVTVSKDFVTVKWTLDDPDGRRIDLLRESLSESGFEELLECLNEIESSAGVSVSGSTRLEFDDDGQTVSDKITARTPLTAEQARKLVDLVKANRVEAPPQVRSRPRVIATTFDDIVESLHLDLGDGRVTDLTRAPVGPTGREELLVHTEGLQNTNGTFEAAIKRVSGGTFDRVRKLWITNLTPSQVSTFDTVTRAYGLSIDPDASVYRATARARHRGDGPTTTESVSGTVTFSRTSNPISDPPNEQRFQITGFHFESKPDARTEVIVTTQDDRLIFSAGEFTDTGNRRKWKSTFSVFMEMLIGDQSFKSTFDALHMSGALSTPPKRDWRYRGGKAPIESNSTGHQSTFQLLRMRLQHPAGVKWNNVP